MIDRMDRQIDNYTIGYLTHVDDECRHQEIKVKAYDGDEAYSIANEILKKILGSDEYRQIRFEILYVTPEGIKEAI